MIPDTVSSATSRIGSSHHKKLRYALDKAASPLGPDFLCKGIAQADGPVEHQASGRRIPIAHEIALPFELHYIGRISRRDRGFDPCIGENFERMRIEIGGEISGVRVGLGEQR